MSQALCNVPPAYPATPSVITAHVVAVVNPSANSTTKVSGASVHPTGQGGSAESDFAALRRLASAAVSDSQSSSVLQQEGLIKQLATLLEEAEAASEVLERVKISASAISACGFAVCAEPVSLPGMAAAQLLAFQSVLPVLLRSGGGSGVRTLQPHAVVSGASPFPTAPPPLHHVGWWPGAVLRWGAAAAAATAVAAPAAASSGLTAAALSAQPLLCASAAGDTTECGARQNQLFWQ
jgi:hypothetical protein